MDKAELILFIILFMWNVSLSFKLSEMNQVLKMFGKLINGFVDGFVKTLEDAENERKNRKNN